MSFTNLYWGLCNAAYGAVRDGLVASVVTLTTLNTISSSQTFLRSLNSNTGNITSSSQSINDLINASSDYLQINSQLINLLCHGSIAVALPGVSLLSLLVRIPNEVIKSTDHVLQPVVGLSSDRNQGLCGFTLRSPIRKMNDREKTKYHRTHGEPNFDPKEHYGLIDGNDSELTNTVDFPHYRH